MTQKTSRNLGWIVLGLLLLLLILIALRRPATVQNVPEPSGQSANQQNSQIALGFGLSVPWDIEFLPSGQMLFTERNGHAFLLQDGSKIDLGFVKGTIATGEGGLMGVALDPRFQENSFLYFYYTYQRGQELRNGVSRWRLENNRIADEHHLIETIPASSIHNGGALEFGPDGKLYITIGDIGQSSLAQDTASLGGKVLRINSDGSTPADNPFGNEVWAYGLRNPQGLAWHPVTGALFATEHGPTRMDEINIIERGGNYGWPNYQCDRQVGEALPNQKGPIACYSDFTLAPSGLDFLNPTTLFVGALRGEHLRQINLNSDFRSIGSQSEAVSDLGRIRAVKEHSGRIIFSTSNTDGRGIVREGDDKIISKNLKNE